MHWSCCSLLYAGFISSMKNMVMIWLVGGIITMCLSMLMAVILTSGIRGAKFFKAAIYMPNIISAVALATMWIQYVFNYDYGLLNQIVKAFGGENVRWLGTDLIFWAMMIAFIFGSVGYYMLIFISGIEGIPQDLYEAATIDGANILDRFFQITLPLLKGVIRTCVTFWSINATTFFAGPSKAGKSWLTLWLCLQVAQGKSMWGREIEPHTVLYLSLEDTFNRLQKRLLQLVGSEEAPERLVMQTECSSIGQGLEEQLTSFLYQHLDTGLIVIDTL